MHLCEITQQTLVKINKPWWNYLTDFIKINWVALLKLVVLIHLWLHCRLPPFVSTAVSDKETSHQGGSWYRGTVVWERDTAVREIMWPPAQNILIDAVGQRLCWVVLPVLWYYICNTGRASSSPVTNRCRLRKVHLYTSDWKQWKFCTVSAQ